MLSVKQGSIKHRFLSLWYDLTCDWTQVSQANGEHSKNNANVQYQREYIYLCIDMNNHLPMLFNLK